MTTLPNMTLILPTLGGDSGAWDDKINAGFGLIDAHDHTSGKGVAVPVAGLDIDSDIAMGGYGLTSVGKVALSAVTALTSGSKTIFVSSSDNELYWRTHGGANVKLTNGSSINTTLVGGIVGDYSTVGAEVAFNDANQVYTFKDQSAPTKKWARLASGPVRIYEYDTTESVYVEHAVDAALASSYTVTWPAAVPGSTALVQISAAGAVSFSNTVANAVTLSDHLTVAVDKNINLSGTGAVLHGEYGISDTAAGRCLPGAAGVAHGNGPQPALTVTSGSQANIHAPVFPRGGRALKFKITGAGTGASTAPTIAVNRLNSDNTLTVIAVTTTLSAGVVTAAWEYTMTVDTPAGIGEGATYVVRYTPAGADAYVYSITTKYDRTT